MATEPRTLQEAILYFADADNCVSYLVARRWPDGTVKCPTCGRTDVAYIPARRVWQCKTRHPKAQFSIKVGTIFEDSPIGLDKWLMAMWMLANCKNGASSYELHRSTGISQKSAWFVLHRIRLALRDDQSAMLSDEVEADETFVGGKVINMHRAKRARVQQNSQKGDKAIVLGLLEREGRVKAAVAPTRKHYDVHANVLANVEPGTTLYTDEYNAYQSLPPGLYTHEIVNKLEGYVKGRVHVNGMENFWSLLKRGLKGTYVSVDPVHLQAYVDEQVFRFNNRKDLDGAPLTDSERFDLAVRQIVGKRLTWAEVTGKEGKKPDAN